MEDNKDLKTVIDSVYCEYLDYLESIYMENISKDEFLKRCKGSNIFARKWLGCVNVNELEEIAA